MERIHYWCVDGYQFDAECLLEIGDTIKDAEGQEHVIEDLATPFAIYAGDLREEEIFWI